MSAITSGESDADEKRDAENKIREYMSFKDSLSKFHTESQIDIPKVIRGRELVFSGAYDLQIQTSQFKEFFIFEREFFKDLDKNGVGICLNPCFFCRFRQG